jgi:hypothetical protein
MEEGCAGQIRRYVCALASMKCGSRESILTEEDTELEKLEFSRTLD